MPTQPSIPLTPEGTVLRAQMPELDTLRGVAVALVVLFHSFGFFYGVSRLSGIPKLLVALTMPGWTGVNLFFVLSGFLITGILLDTKCRSDYYQRFYFRRALRILPLYYATLILLFVLARTGLVPRHASWAFIGLSAAYLANVTTLFGVPMQYGVLWSLAVEEHFYLLWPTLVRSLSRRRVIIAAGCVVVACLSLRIVYFVLHIAGGGYTWLSADGLALGAIVASAARDPEQPRSALRKATLMTTAAGGSMLIIGAPCGILMARHFLGVTFRETALDLVFTGLVGATLLLGSSPRKRIVNLRPFQFLGRISYGVYLTHMLVYELTLHFMNRYWPQLPSAGNHFSIMVLFFSIAATLTIALTYLSRNYFEEFFLALKNLPEKRVRETLQKENPELARFTGEARPAFFFPPTESPR